MQEQPLSAPYSPSKQRKQQVDKCKTTGKSGNSKLSLRDVTRHTMLSRSGSHASGLSHKTSQTEQTVSTAASRIAEGEDDDVSFRVTRLIDDVLEETDEDLLSTVTSETRSSHGSRGSKSKGSTSRSSSSKQSRGNRHSIEKPASTKKFPSNKPRALPTNSPRSSLMSKSSTASKSTSSIDAEGSKKKLRARRVSSLEMPAGSSRSAREKSQPGASAVVNHQRRRASTTMQRQSSIRSREPMDTSMSDSSSVRLKSHFSLSKTTSLLQDGFQQSSPLPLDQSLQSAHTTKSNERRSSTSLLRDSSTQSSSRRNHPTDKSTNPSSRQSREARRLEFRKFQQDMQEKQKVRTSTLDNLPGGAIPSREDDEDTFDQLLKERRNRSPKANSEKTDKGDLNLDHLMKKKQEKTLDGHFKPTKSASVFEDDASLDTVDHFVRDQREAGNMKLIKPQATLVDGDSFRLFDQQHALDAIDPTALDSPVKETEVPQVRMSALDLGLSNVFDEEDFPAAAFQKESRQSDRHRRGASDKNRRGASDKSRGGADRSRSRSRRSTRTKESVKHDTTAPSSPTKSRKSKTQDTESSKSRRASRRKSIKNSSHSSASNNDVKSSDNDTTSNENSRVSSQHPVSPSKSKRSRRLSKASDLSGSLPVIPTIEPSTPTSSRRSRRLKDPSLDNSSISQKSEAISGPFLELISPASSRRSRKFKDPSMESSNRSKDTISKTEVEKERRRSSRRSSRRRASLASPKAKVTDVLPETPSRSPSLGFFEMDSPASIDTASTAGSTTYDNKDEEDKARGGKVIRASRRRSRLGSLVMNKSSRGVDESPRTRSFSLSSNARDTGDEKKKDRRRDLAKAVSSFAT